MSTNNESDTEKRSIFIPDKEIKNFEIRLEFSLYWISYDKHNYPIIMTPHEFGKLFEIEGIPIESFTAGEPIRFTKAVLMRAGYTNRGDVFGEEGDDLTPQYCWVKEPASGNPTETQLVPTSF